MAINFDKVAKSVWQILKGRGNKLKIYGEDGQPTLSPEGARRMYIEDEGIMVSINEIGEDSEIKVYLSSQNELDDIKPLLQNLRQTANFYAVNYNVRKYGKKLLPKQFKFLTHKVNRDEELVESLNYKNQDVKFRFPAGFKNDLNNIIENPKAYAGLIKMRNGVYVLQLARASRSDKGMITRKTNKGEWVRFKDFANGTIRTYVETSRTVPVNPEPEIEQEETVLDEFAKWVDNFSIGDKVIEEELVQEDDVDDEDLSDEILADPTLKHKIMTNPKKELNKFVDKEEAEEPADIEPSRREFTKKR